MEEGQIQSVATMLESTYNLQLQICGLAKTTKKAYRRCRQKGWQKHLCICAAPPFPTFQRACHPCCCCVSSAWHTDHHHMVQSCKRTNPQYHHQYVIHRSDQKYKPLYLNECGVLDYSSCHGCCKWLARQLLLLPRRSARETSGVASLRPPSTNQHLLSDHTTSVLGICFADAGCQILLKKKSHRFFLLDIILDMIELLSTEETKKRY